MTSSSGVAAEDLEHVRHDTPMPQLALSAIGRDRPGIVAEVTRALLGHSLNITDSQMAVLCGRFTMMLIVYRARGHRPRLRARGARAHARAAGARRALAEPARRGRRPPPPPRRRTSSPSTASTTRASSTPSPLASPPARSTSPTSRRGSSASGQAGSTRWCSRWRCPPGIDAGGAAAMLDGGGRRAGRRRDRPPARTGRHVTTGGPRGPPLPAPRAQAGGAGGPTTPARSRAWRRTWSTRWTRSATASGWRPRSSASWCGWSSSTSPAHRRRRRRTGGSCSSTRGSSRAAGAEVGREGCLCIPHLTANVRRATDARGRGATRRLRRSSSAGFEARCLHHEIDHLDGLLFLDRVDSLTTDVFRRKRTGAGT